MNKLIASLLALIAVLVICLIIAICFALNRSNRIRKESDTYTPVQAEQAVAFLESENQRDKTSLTDSETMSASDTMTVNQSDNESNHSDSTEALPINPENDSDTPQDANSGSTSGRSQQIDVENILQYPELPTGCETTALTILLNHLGYNADKLTIAREYLPKLDFYWEDDICYGADFHTTFAGDPENEYSYGCYAPCIVTAANSYLSDIGAEVSAYDETGYDFDSLLTDYIDNDIPVLIWITSSNLHETELTSTWVTPQGTTVQWVAYEHCVVLTGYDMDNGLVYVSDPLVGNVSYDMSKLKQRYSDMGYQCVRIE